MADFTPLQRGIETAGESFAQAIRDRRTRESKTAALQLDRFFKQQEFARKVQSDSVQGRLSLLSSLNKGIQDKSISDETFLERINQRERLVHGLRMDLGEISANTPFTPTQDISRFSQRRGDIADTAKRIDDLQSRTDMKDPAQVVQFNRERMRLRRELGGKIREQEVKAGGAFPTRPVTETTRRTQLAAGQIEPPSLVFPSPTAVARDPRTGEVVSGAVTPTREKFSIGNLIAEAADTNNVPRLNRLLNVQRRVSSASSKAQQLTPINAAKEIVRLKKIQADIAAKTVSAESIARIPGLSEGTKALLLSMSQTRDPNTDLELNTVINQLIATLEPIAQQSQEAQPTAIDDQIADIIERAKLKQVQ